MRQADVVEPVQQAMLAERIDIERDHAAIGPADFLRLRDRSLIVALAPRSASSISLSTSSGGR